MKTLLLLLISFCFFPAFGQDKIEIIENKTLSISADNNFTIINADPEESVPFFDGDEGKELRIGWNKAGHAMRSFVVFNLPDIKTKPAQELTFGRALLIVHESNTVLHPFGENRNRSIQVDMMRFEPIDSLDFNSEAFSKCGAITSWGYNVLKDYALNVNTAFRNFYFADSLKKNKVCFRLRIDADNNVSDINSSPLDGSMWNIFAIENKQFAPVLVIKYTITEKVEEKLE